MSVSAPSLVGRTIDQRYLVREHLADGGMATVFIALDQRLDREVALKIMRPDLARDENFVARFRREARSAARLSHPGVVAVTDQGSDEDFVFLAMELVRGPTLRALIRSEAPMPVRQALDLGEGIVAALEAAHDAGLVHRDVKPENVLLGPSGVKVADFGLARAVTTDTLTGDTDVLLGTAAYLSPEQVERGVADERTDVYAAGLLLFEMLTGRKAFPGDSPINVAYQHVHGTMPRPSELVPTIPPAVDELVLRACATDPADRPANAGAMLRGLREARSTLGSAQLDLQPSARAADDVHTTGPLTGDSTRHLPRRGASAAPPRRSRRPALLAALIAVVLVLAALGAWAMTAGPLGSVRVPTVAGQRQGRAVEAVHRAGLHVQVHEAFSEKVADGVVLSSAPRAGHSTRKNSTVTLTVSKGAQRFAVPAVTGRSEAGARRALTAAHLRVGQVTTSYDGTVPKGKVIRTSPQSGSAQRQDSAVQLVVSAGAEPIEVPDVTDLPKDDARQQLTDAGFRVRVGKSQHDDTVPAGQVISQDPSGTAQKGDTITLVVSLGGVEVTVPKVTGQSPGDARSTLEALGFKVTTHYPLLVPVLFDVRGQSVSPGDKAAKGSTITLEVY